jgi:hypothetical protein
MTGSVRQPGIKPKTETAARHSVRRLIRQIHTRTPVKRQPSMSNRNDKRMGTNESNPTIPHVTSPISNTSPIGDFHRGNQSNEDAESLLAPNPLRIVAVCARSPRITELSVETG